MFETMVYFDDNDDDEKQDLQPPYLINLLALFLLLLFLFLIFFLLLLQLPLPSTSLNRLCIPRHRRPRHSRLLQPLNNRQLQLSRIRFPSNLLTIPLHRIKLSLPFIRQQPFDNRPPATLASTLDPPTFLQLLGGRPDRTHDDLESVERRVGR